MRHARLAVLGMALCAASAAGHAQQVRPGLWEFDGQHMRLVQGKQTLDMQKIQQQMDAQMRTMDTETRRFMEENLRGSGIPIGKGRTLRMCVPGEQANLARLAERQSLEGCQFNLQEKGTDFVRGQLRCTESEATGMLLSTLITPERINNRAELSTPKGKLIINSHAQWLGTECGDAPVIGMQSLQDRSLFGGEKAH